MESFVRVAHSRARNLAQNAKTISLTAMALAAAAPAAADEWPLLPAAATTTTVPANGDLNPYGVVFIPSDAVNWKGSPLKPGDILVSNFNAMSNLQGTGTTIIQYTPSDKVFPAKNAQVFFQETGGAATPPGLTMALGVLKRGAIIVGVLSTTDGTSATAAGGPLLVLDVTGKLLQSIAPGGANKINGPWGLAIADHYSSANIFVSNVLDGTITRLDVTTSATGAIAINQATTIASGYGFRTDAAALELGPAGLAYEKETDTLYVASEVDNAIYKVANATMRSSSTGKGVAFASGGNLRAPLGLALAPDGRVIVSNADAVNADVNHPSEILEFTHHGQFVTQFNVNEAEGAAFGVAVHRLTYGEQVAIELAAVNDVSNDVSVRLLTNERK